MKLTSFLHALLAVAAIATHAKASTTPAINVAADIPNPVQAEQAEVKVRYIPTRTTSVPQARAGPADPGSSEWPKASKNKKPA
ncbi:hypothetical protein OC835_004993 [Tilletia horrida]|nr:hypothetical protein OC835_004993 [Tilletia horrida]